MPVVGHAYVFGEPERLARPLLFVSYSRTDLAHARPVIDLLEDPNRQPWLEVRVRLDEPQPDLRQQIESALQGKAVRLVRISAEYAGRSALDEDQLQFVELSQMTPQDLFSRVWEQAYGNPVDEQTLSDFALLLQDVQLEEEQP